MPVPGSPSDGAWLRFSCPACGRQLQVAPALAGVTGPCPSCGARVTAAAEGSVASKVSIRPRSAARRAVPVSAVPPPEEDQPVIPPPPRRQGRSVLPTGGIHSGPDEVREAVTLVKIVVAAVVVGVVCAVVVAVVKGGFGFF